VDRSSSFLGIKLASQVVWFGERFRTVAGGVSYSCTVKTAVVGTDELVLFRGPLGSVGSDSSWFWSIATRFGFAEMSRSGSIQVVAREGG
jgi:hypothetical protein